MEDCSKESYSSQVRVDNSGSNDTRERTP